MEDAPEVHLRVRIRPNIRGGLERAAGWAFDARRESRQTEVRMKTCEATLPRSTRQTVCHQPDVTSLPWIVCHRHFDHGQVCLYAFSTEERAYLHAARLIRDELGTLLELDGDRGSELVQALREGRFQMAVELYHAIEGNLDEIDVTPLDLDQFHKDEPLDVAG